jgi:predicted TIM-barrel fold metal-dependent hydrolase
LKGGLSKNEACEKFPDRFGIMARIPQNKPEEAKAMMRDWKSIPYIKGTRLTFHRPTDRNWMIDGTCDWYRPFAEEHDVKTMVHAPIWKAELGAIAKRHPNLRIIIDHMGIMSRCIDDSIDYWVQETADLHIHPNIYVKVSPVPAYSTQHFPYTNITKYVRALVDKIGARRCFWGTDITRLMDHGLTYKETIDHFTEHMGFSDEELKWIMGQGICDCLDWPATDAAASSNARAAR